MTKFEELMDIISRKKNKGKLEKENNDDNHLEVAGTESTTTKGPLVATANDELDPDIIDMLYTKPRNVPNRGENASSWDSD